MFSLPLRVFFTLFPYYIVKPLHWFLDLFYGLPGLWVGVEMTSAVLVFVFVYGNG
jgi:hypothetical protein